MLVIAKDCGDPGHLANGDVMGGDYTYGRIVNYTCDPGWRLEGHHAAQCKADATWSHTIPICRRKCDNPYMYSTVTDPYVHFYTFLYM